MLTVITNSSQASAARIDLPDYAGLDLIINRRGIGFLRSDEYEVLSTGGFRLIGTEGNVMVAGETFSVFPLATSQNFPLQSPSTFTQYPHILTGIIGTEAMRDTNGNWIPGNDQMVYSRCRAEAVMDVNDGVIEAADGKRVDYSWIVYMPRESGAILKGTKIVITHDAKTIVNDHAKRFHKGLLNARLWL